MATGAVDSGLGFDDAAPGLRDGVPCLADLPLDLGDAVPLLADLPPGSGDPVTSSGGLVSGPKVVPKSESFISRFR